MPLRGVDLLEATSRWVSIAVGREDGATVVRSDLDESPADRDPRSISWSLEGADKLGQVVVWEDGQAELDLVDACTGEVTSEHRHVDERSDLESLLSEVRDWVTRDAVDGKAIQ